MADSIIMPERFNDKLKKDRTWHANVNIVIGNAEDIYRRHPRFFPEYTDHGIIHVNHILDISDHLIPADSLKTMSERSLAIYIIALILHDIGMYITYDGFKEIISPDSPYSKIEFLDKASMKECWEDYLSELRLYSDKQLISKFGTTDIQFNGLKEELDLDEKDILVIGEFLRKYHHVLSQYIILYGMAGIDDFDVLKVKIDENVRDIIGLIARSHGMNLRDTEAYLHSKYGMIKQPSNVEIFYLMALLRLADYLDVGEERASHIVESMYVKYSEISKGEFAWNQCLQYEACVWETSQNLLSIDALPEKPYHYIKITQWLKAVQYEIDLCWAIIGEHYDLNNYQLSIRRIHSNLLKEQVIKDYEKRFYTKEARLEANADILKLLIEPLYGNDPSYGVRELLQNATDACKERAKIELSNGNDYTGRVSVFLDTKNKSFTMTDDGIGMKIDTIVNYYLSSGASYRRSDVWRKTFADENGKSKVLRNGKFGVGVLATFLLGETAKITTRHMDDELGWEFEIKLDQENIDIKRVNADIGTTVSIELSQSVIEKMNKLSRSEPIWYKWYDPEEKIPEIVYMQDGKIIETSHKASNWFELRQNEFESYKWTYNRRHLINNQSAYCNGILVPRLLIHFSNINKFRFNLYVPNLKIEDADGRLPINLSRSSLTAIPCEEELFTECCKYALAKLFTVDFHNYDYNKHFNFHNLTRLSYHTDNDPLVYSKDGYMPADAAFLSHAGIKSLRLICAAGRVHDARAAAKDFGMPVMFCELLGGQFAENVFDRVVDGIDMIYGINCNLQLMYINEKYYIYIEKYLPLIRKNLYIEKEKNYYILSHKPVSNGKELDFDINDCPMVADYSLYFINHDKDDIMLKVFREYMPENTVIPYDMEDRKKLFPKAFEELKKYM